MLSCRVEGDGDTITDQTPAGGAIIPGKSVVILYANEKKSTDKCVVPTLLGRHAVGGQHRGRQRRAADPLLRHDGQRVQLHPGAESEPGGRTEVDAGTVITVQLGDTSVTD